MTRLHIILPEYPLQQLDSGLSSLSSFKDSLLDWRSRGSLVISQLGEDTKEVMEEEEEQTVPDIITSMGYKVGNNYHFTPSRNNCQVEIHLVTTPDGYLLQLHRILPEVPAGVGGGRPVFLQHGLLQSSYVWVTSGASR